MGIFHYEGLPALWFVLTLFFLRLQAGYSSSDFPEDGWNHQ